MEGFSGNIDGGDIALATDFYELAMAAAYYYSNYQTTYDINKIKGIFEMFVRKLPRNRSYLVAAGLEQRRTIILSKIAQSPLHVMRQELMKRYYINLRLALRREHILAPSKYTESWKTD